MLLKNYVNEMIYRYFIEKGELFRLVMDSKQMVLRGRRIAKGIAKQLYMLGFNKGKILDVGCGTGRVSIPLAEMGFDVVGIDISPTYIDIANKRAKEKGLESKALFFVCDAREMSKCVESYRPFTSVIFVWSSVLGYYDEETDMKILSMAYEVSADKASLIIADAVNKEYISFSQYVLGFTKRVAEYDNVVVIEKTIYNPATGNVLIKQDFYRRDKNNLLFLGESHFEFHVYSLDELVKLANKAGWCLHKVLVDLSGEARYSPMNSINVIFSKCRQ